ncbi:chordin-like protein 2 isoform X2 [Homarus americanus]|uniref:chordin-like protein 2 isoform X2 n=1 Tax=Homarus americanus TaxID=6706 RepID=UPI001C44F383|nr:chordin-like protein 2 isoform X2 [Homarus americanus]
MEVVFKVSVLVWAIVILLAPTQAQGGCRLGPHEYRVGEVWHPRLRNSQSNYCVTCRCILNEDGELDYDCSSEPCPEGCSGGPDQGECCSICSAPEEGNSSGEGNGASSSPTNTGTSSSVEAETAVVSSSSSSDSDSLFMEPMLGEASSRVCVVAGMMYNHGDTFSSNYSDAVSDKCEHCYCNDGEAQCRTKTCPQVSCSTPIYTRRDCCRVCPDDSTELDWDTMVSFTDPSAPKGSSDHDCKIGGRYFINGSIWHPVIGPFGEMDCVLCKCYNRRIDCSRLKCQSRDKLQCNKPIKVAGQCCPICPLKLLINTSPQASRGTARCLSDRSQQAVWKNNGAGNNSGVLHYVFEPLEGGTSNILHLHRMILKNRNLEKLDILDISRSEFRDLRSTYTFSLLGGTSTRLMNRFKKREQRVERRCKKKGRCNLQLEGMEKILKVKPAQERARCPRGERQI